MAAFACFTAAAMAMVALRVGLAHGTPDFPEWPEAYAVKFKFSVPYVETYQDGPLKYDMQFYRDSKAGKQKVERSHVETWYEDCNKDRRWYVQPGNFSQTGCLAEKMTAAGGPTRRRLLGDGKEDKCYDLFSPALPRVSGPAWAYNGTAALDHGGESVAAHVWRYHTEHDEGYGNIQINWYLYTDKKSNSVPLKLDMWGINWFTGGHWDHYVAEFYEYAERPDFPEGFWDMPEVCDGAPFVPDAAATPLTGGHHLSARLHKAMHGVVPHKHAGADPEYDAHCHVHGRAHAHATEYLERRAHYYANKQLVAAHNGKRARGFEQALNQFADWLDAEYSALVKGNKRQQRIPGLGATEYEPSWPLHMLPNAVDWRGTPADSVMKDQAMCGSCWSFASVAPMEAAYYRHYGERKLLSEQYLMDCSWLYGNTGCNGGFQEPAFEFTIANGGIASEAEYPYHGVNMQCNNDTPLAMAMAEYVRVPAYNKTLFQEALLTQGPMAVSVNADAPSFKFYKSGIFYEPSCVSHPPSELDHAVVASGYGRDANTGQRFWIMKNIWSSYWGEGGHMRIDMDRNDCGLSATPEFVRVDAAVTDKLRAAEATRLRSAR